MATDNFKARRAEYFAARMDALMDASGNLIKSREKLNDDLQDSSHEIDRLAMLEKRRINDASKLRKLGQFKTGQLTFALG
ncbi:MAG: hypothetical protein ABL885_02435 [Methylophilaceae bacterium]